MFKRRKEAATDNSLGTPLGIQSADGALQRGFDINVVNSFRHMATELAYNGALPHRISFISALRGDGVSYNALAFGTTLANDMQMPVCVVELNWWSPGMLRLLAPDATSAAPKGRHARKTAVSPSSAATLQISRPGLAQVLDKTVTLEDALISTEQPRLHLLPAGDLPIERRPNQARSEALQSLINDLSQRYTYLILDIPAILSTSDSIALASLGEACVVVVRHGITPISKVKHALDDVRHMTMLGVVLNQAALATPRWLHSLIPQE